MKAQLLALKKKKQVLAKKKFKKVRLYDKVVSVVRDIQKRGELTAETVLEEAQKTSSPLHSLFVWNLANHNYVLRLFDVSEIRTGVDFS